MGVMMFVVAFGLGSVVLANHTVLRVLNWIGAAFLLWLAWKIATAGRSHAAAGRKPVARRRPASPTGLSCGVSP
jgi:threonine/homoserine/homoserine lactone efflux protein